MEEESELWVLTNQRFKRMIEQLVQQTEEALSAGRETEAATLTEVTRTVLEQYKAWKRESEPHHWYWRSRQRHPGHPPPYPPPYYPPPRPYPGPDRREWLLPHEDIGERNE